MALFARLMCTGGANEENDGIEMDQIDEIDEIEVCSGGAKDENGSRTDANDKREENEFQTTKVGFHFEAS